MKKLIKTYIHCFYNLLKLNLKEDHKVCSVEYLRKPKRYFCSCGYLNKGIKWKDYLK